MSAQTQAANEARRKPTRCKRCKQMQPSYRAAYSHCVGKVKRGRPACSK